MLLVFSFVFFLSQVKVLKFRSEICIYKTVCVPILIRIDEEIRLTRVATFLDSDLKIPEELTAVSTSYGKVR